MGAASGVDLAVKCRSSVIVILGGGLCTGMYCQEFSVAGAVHAHNVLVILADFNDNTCFVPLGGVIASLLLNTHVMTNFEWGKLACVFIPTFS